MNDDILLMIPGPTNLPEKVRRALGEPAFYHRCDRCADMLVNCTEGMKQILGTAQDVLTLTSSGTGGMEAAIANLINPDDRVLSIRTGKFGSRLGEIAERYGALVSWLEVEPGRAAEPQQLADILSREPFKAVTMAHNETSTGITQNVASLAKIAADYRCLTIVDTISGAGGIPVKMDEWGLDAVITGSQKALMLPPGLAFVAFSPRAWGVADNAKSPRYYFDLIAARDRYQEKKQTPYTISVSLLAALDAALDVIFEEGLQNVYNRHAAAGKAVRAGMQALDLELFADPAYASNTVTAVHSPSQVDSRDLVKKMVDEHNIRISGGQGDLAGKIFRIGHMGVFDADILSDTVHAIGESLADLGHDCDPQAAAHTVEEEYQP